MSKFYKYNLLIEKYSQNILECINSSKYTLIKGPTGCGKSTYIPLLLNNKNIAIIQPRRIAVTSLHSTLSNVTENVGYKMRFNKKISKNDKIVIYTDGAFLNDVFETEYDYIIVDEVHERSVRTDVLLCLLKQTKSKVILMSATVDTCKIQKYFNASVFEIPGESFPCEIIYSETPVADYILESYTIIKEIIMNNSQTKNAYNNKNDLSWLEKSKISFENNKDILVFLTGEEDINELATLLKKILGIKILKIYSSLSDEEQTKIYEKSNLRKIILSTNICETSLTIPGIKYVIDTGLVKNKIYDGINYFGILQISKESADQRLGRCNRTGPGICYRLYTEKTYKNFQNLIPEICVADLSRPILQLIQRKINIFKFDFLDFPTQKNVERSLKFLFNKNLINENLQITKHGNRILSYPLEIHLSCFYDDCLNNNLGMYGSILVSLISIDNYNFIRNINTDKLVYKSDIKYLVDLFNEFINSKNKKDFCKLKDVSLKNLEKAHKIYKSLNKNKKGDFELLEKIFSKSFEHNLSIKEEDGAYRHLGTNKKVYIHPSSYLFKRNEKKIVFVDSLCTTKEYVRIVSKYIK